MLVACAVEVFDVNVYINEMKHERTMHNYNAEIGYLKRLKLGNHIGNLIQRKTILNNISVLQTFDPSPKGSCSFQNYSRMLVWM